MISETDGQRAPEQGQCFSKPDQSSLTAMILAAGEGTRLRPLTLWRAKPAVPFLNRPLIHYALDLVYGLNPETLVVNLHYLSESVVEAIRDYRPKPGVAAVEPTFSREAVILGTAGGVRAARDFLMRGDLIALVNGKIFSNFSLAPAVTHHLRCEALVTLVVIPQEPASPFNPVRVDPDGRVLGFGPRGKGHWHTFTGIQIWSRPVLKRLSEKHTDLVKDLYPFLIDQGERVVAWNAPGFWCEASTPRRYFDNSLLALSSSGDDGAPFLDPVNGVIRHPGSEVAQGSRLHNTIVWNGCTIGEGCSLENVVLCTGVDVGDGIRLRNSILTPHLGGGPPDASLSSQVISYEDYLAWPISEE